MRYWLVLSLACGAVALAGNPPTAPPSPPPAAPNGSPQSGANSGVPDDEFIEFLGSDDVGDTDLWDFLKNSARPGQPPASTPQES